MQAPRPLSYKDVLGWLHSQMGQPVVVVLDVAGNTAAVLRGTLVSGDEEQMPEGAQGWWFQVGSDEDSSASFWIDEWQFQAAEATKARLEIHLEHGGYVLVDANP
jgi:hypothetical protein